MDAAIDKHNGAGATCALDLTRPEDMKMLRDAIRKQWDVPDKYLEDAAPLLWKVATESEDERAVVAALRTLKDMHKDNWDRAEAVLEAFKAKQTAPAVQNNLQVNVQGGPAEMFRALMRELKNGAERNPQEAPAEPAGDDQS